VIFFDLRRLSLITLSFAINCPPEQHHFGSETPLSIVHPPPQKEKYYELPHPTGKFSCCGAVFAYSLANMYQPVQQGS
jgi:hypothetical protein